ncbi:MAG: nucleotide exchange factor GrpE [Clostridiales bacterium]|nr:nucleotide exchange factor GrpE [Clostridiales bacterium]
MSGKDNNQEDIDKKEINSSQLDNSQIKNYEKGFEKDKRIVMSEIDDELVKTIEKGMNSSNDKNKKFNNILILEEKNKGLVNQVEILKESLLRKSAEFDNYKKRTDKEKEESYDFSLCKFIRNVLPILDNLNRAINSCGEDFEKNSFFLGIENIEKQFKETLKNMGLQEIETVGQIFDPHFHEAVVHVENKELGENIITKEIQKGYLCNKKLVRHSLVEVAN